MWIRSQSRKNLGNYKYLYTRGKEIYAETNMDTDILGEYATPERVLQVLDDIQNKISSIESFKLSKESLTGQNFVYQMPEQ